jgi:hypothetical protein
MARKRKINGRGGSTLRVYGAYVFKDKAPSIDEFRTLCETHFGHRVTNNDLRQIEGDGGPTVSCMRGWLFGDTMRPQDPTMEAAGRAMGYRRVWQRMRRNV